MPANPSRGRFSASAAGEFTRAVQCFEVKVRKSEFNGAKSTRAFRANSRALLLGEGDDL
jgi:hypothetical protein